MPGVRLKGFLEMAELVGAGLSKERAARFQKLAKGAFVGETPQTTLYRTSGGPRLLRLPAFQNASLRLALGLSRLGSASEGTLNGELLRAPIRLDADELVVIRRAMEQALHPPANDPKKKPAGVWRQKSVIPTHEEKRQTVCSVIHL